MVRELIIIASVPDHLTPEFNIITNAKFTESQIIFSEERGPDMN